MRYIFNSPLTWSEELAVFAMVWLTFIGSVICMRDREHIEIEILVDHLPPKLRRVVIVVSRMISALFLLLLAWYGLELTMENFSTKSAANGIPMGYVYVIIPLGALGMLYYVVKSIRKGA
jgi:TRAP-type C4-dicarboxylate transport system permease small subunit